VGIYDRDYFREQQPSGLSSYLPRSAVGAIIAVNAAVWLVDAFTSTTNHTGLASGPKTINWVSYLFAAHVSTLTHPWYWWQFLTAGFTHAPLGSKDGIWHIVGNMAVLYFLGRPVEDKYGPKEFLRFYLVALVFANVAWCVIGKLTGAPAGAGIYGASGAIAAVVVLFAFNFPDVTILLFFVIPMPAWLFGVLIVGYDIYGAIGGNRGSNVAYTAHVAGAAFALLYYQRGWSFSRFGIGGLRWPRSPFRPKPSLRVHHPDDEPPPSDLSAEVDRILEKIYREGEASLTPKERSTLEAASRKYQDRRGSGK
jgi:membrane associated rhomboid family serine protease